MLSVLHRLVHSGPQKAKRDFRFSPNFTCLSGHSSTSNGSLIFSKGWRSIQIDVSKTKQGVKKQVTAGKGSKVPAKGPPKQKSENPSSNRGNGGHILSIEESLKKASEERRLESGMTIEEMYQKKTPIEHILLRPDTYIGSLVRTKQMQWIYQVTQRTVQQRECSYVPGLYKIFDEIVVNAADHKQRDPTNMTTIRVDIDAKEGIISVFNDGAGIPVQIHREEGVYLPELLLGHLLTGSNFNDNIAKVTGGRNGYGAKLANIFSSEFTVETFDQSASLFYKQSWSKHMEVCNPPEILSQRPIDAVGKKRTANEPTSTRPIQPTGSPFYYGQTGGFTRITFKPDLALFNMRKLSGDDILALMQRRAYDLAACLPSVKVFLNGELLPNNFAHLYAVNSKEDLVVTEVNKRWTVGVGATVEPGQLTQLSFVNCIHTLNGGTHVNYIADQVVRYVADKIKKRHKSLNVTPTQIKNHLVIVIRCLIENPAFDSQTKERLMTKADHFGSECVLDERTLKEIVARSGIVDFVTKQAEHLQKQALARTAHSSKRNKLVGIPKLDDANEAGGPRSKECTLIITEGDSAKSLAVSGLSIVGRDFYGVYPVQGKMLNVREAATPKVIENKEIKDLIQAIGLNPQRNYANWDVDSGTLRYGKVMLMADQDPDGSHIKGLFINFLHHFWPNLLKHPGFLFEFVTPLIKATKRSSVSSDEGGSGSPNSEKLEKSVSFFTMVEYEKWKGTVDVKQWNVKYYKGLGTNTSAEAKQYFSNLKKHVVQFMWKPEADGLIDMAFNKKFAAERRMWLLGYDPKDHVDTSKGILDYANFINKELIAFSHYDNLRSIPSVVDGLKPSQRKVLFSSFKRRLHSEIKVVQLAGYVSEQAGYHHGEQSLQGTIVNMAQNFVGSNNLPLLVPSGQFGTRLQGGKDAASARYIFTRLSKFSRLLFPEDDDFLLNYLDDDGYPIEPEYYVPIIPLLLVNGAEGVGTGWSTKVPSYNPLDIIANLRLLLEEKPMNSMQPFFRGFKGYTRANRDGGYLTQGIFARTPQGQLRIIELPVGRWTNDYKLFLETLVKEKRYIKEYSEYHTDEVVSFLITPLSPEVIDSDKHIIERFKLEDFIHERNMSAFDATGNLKKFVSPLEILEAFYPVRLSFYEKRKQWKFQQLSNTVRKLSNQSRFASSVIDGTIKLLNQPRQAVIQQLESLGFHHIDNSYSYLLSTSLLHMTSEHIEKLKRETEEQQEALKILESTSSKTMWIYDLDKLENVVRIDAAFTDPPLTLGTKLKIPPIPAAKIPSPPKKKNNNKNKTPIQPATTVAAGNLKATTTVATPPVASASAKLKPKPKQQQRRFPKSIGRQKLVKINPEDQL
jgi:DNA topoisomerase-2